MLTPTDAAIVSFVDSFKPAGEYLLENVRLDIPDPVTAIFNATLVGPPGAPVWARAWMSNAADGTLAEAESPKMVAGDDVTLVVQLTGDGSPELACMRIDSAPLETRHTMHSKLP